MLRHPALYCRNCDEYRDEMMEWNKIPPSPEKLNAILELKREVERTKQKMVEFAKGVVVKTVKTQYGEIIKIGINVDEFMQNPINERSYINFDILTSKEGKKYAALDTYKPKQEPIEEMPF